MELKRFRARWRMVNGSWTSGEFDAPNADTVRDTLRQARGREIEVEQIEK